MKPAQLSLKALLLTALIASTSLTLADELVVPVGQQGADKASLEKPKTGMKAEVVEQKFGAPLQKSPAIGTPAISNWQYPEYTVYFEGDRVIHTVLKPAASAAPVEVAPAEITPVEPTPTAPIETAPVEAAPVAP